MFPKLRFKADDGSEFGEWASEKISKVFTNKSKSFNPLLNESLPCIELEHLSQNTGQILGTVNSSDQQSTKNLFEPNSVLYGKLRPYLRKFAKPQFKGVCSSEIWVLTGLKISNDYLFQFVQSEQFTELTNIQSGSKMPRADWNVIADAEIEFPCLEEQTKIASFLSAVDEKISQLTQKHELLSQYKKGMMQKLFSQQIRFRADDGSEFGEWEEKALKDLFPKIRNGFVGVATPYYVDYGVKYLQGKNIKNGKIDATGLIYINQEFHQKKTNSILKTNDILMVQSGHVGECAVVTEDYDYANCHALLVLSPKSSKLIDSKFVVYYFYSEIGKKKIALIKTGNTIEHILASDIKEVSLLFPCIEEQTKIANFLSSIDQKTEVVGQQIEQAKQWKKGLLQNMFI